jgi:hypothetical protein
MIPDTPHVACTQCAAYFSWVTSHCLLTKMFPGLFTEMFGCLKELCGYVHAEVDVVQPTTW